MPDRDDLSWPTDSDEVGFFLSPLRPEMNEKEVREAWRSASD